jgi:hypothetical protein
MGRVRIERREIENEIGCGGRTEQRRALIKIMVLTFLADALMVRVTAVFKPSKWEPPSEVRIPTGHEKKGKSVGESVNVCLLERRAKERDTQR